MLSNPVQPRVGTGASDYAVNIGKADPDEKKTAKSSAPQHFRDRREEAVRFNLISPTRESALPLIQSVLLAGFYMFLCCTFYLLIRYSKHLEKRGEMKYDSAAIVFFMEVTKCFFSVSMMYYRTGKFLPISVFRDGSWRIGVYYAVPSFIYVVYNNLTYWNLTHFDPATYQVFMQTRIIFTGLLYTAILRRVFSCRKWAALVLLTFGVAVKYLTPSLEINAYVLFMLFQASLSAFAGVYNEFLLKKHIQMDVNEQNYFMYIFAIFFNYFFGLFSDPGYYTSTQLFSNINGLLLLIICVGAAMGIITSLILKFINVIVKAFASALEVILTAVLAAIFLGEALTVQDFVAFVIVMTSIYLYYTSH